MRRLKAHTLAGYSGIRLAMANSAENGQNRPSPPTKNPAEAGPWAGSGGVLRSELAAAPADTSKAEAHQCEGGGFGDC